MIFPRGGGAGGDGAGIASVVVEQRAHGPDEQFGIFRIDGDAGSRLPKQGADLGEVASDYRYARRDVFEQLVGKTQVIALSQVLDEAEPEIGRGRPFMEFGRWDRRRCV